MGTERDTLNSHLSTNNSSSIGNWFEKSGNMHKRFPESCRYWRDRSENRTEGKEWSLLSSRFSRVSPEREDIYVLGENGKHTSSGRLSRQLLLRLRSFRGLLWNRPIPSMEWRTFSLRSRISVFDTLESVMFSQMIEMLPFNCGALRSNR